MDHVAEAQAIGKAQVAILQDLRTRLLHLHKTLLEMERLNFEKKSGRVTPGELLQLVINDPQFAWLRTISALVVEIGANDIGALARKDQRGGAPDAARGTGDDDRLPREIVRRLRHGVLLVDERRRT